MTPMSRDKCGAASSCGVMAAVAAMKPAGVKVRPYLLPSILLSSLVPFSTSLSSSFSCRWWLHYAW